MPPRDTRRPDRVAEAVREEIATILTEGVKDPRVTGFITVTGVEMTRDLAEAVVYVSIYAEEPARSTTLEGLQSVGTMMRSRIGRALRLRLAPRLTFKLDESIARAARIETLLNSVRPVDMPAGDMPAVDAPANDAGRGSGDAGAD